MKVEILYFDDCPNCAVAQWILREVMAEEGTPGEVELIAVNTNEEAQSLKFPGSPTIRLDGRDLFPAAEYEGYRLGCRIYSTPEGFKGYPTAQMFREALLKGGLRPTVVFRDDVRSLVDCGAQPAPKGASETPGADDESEHH